VGNFGHTNADFVESYFIREGLNVAAKSLRGNQARRLRYYPTTGRALVSQGRDTRSDEIAAREARIASRITILPRSPGVEIFDTALRSKPREAR
jgi:chemotaxis protein CheD